MKTRKEYRAAARESLKGRWTPAVMGTLLYVAIVLAISIIEGTGDSLVRATVALALMFFFAAPFGAAMLNAYRSYAKRETEDIAAPVFKEMGQRYGKYLGAVILVGLFVTLWTFLLIIPAIIMSIAYQMTFYIIKDKPELSCLQAIKLSRKMMKGHKWEFFLLGLSFIGWGILGIFTLGIGYLWLYPYMYSTVALYYEDLKAEYEASIQ